AKDKGIKLNFIKIDSLEKAKNAPCIFNNWANFYKGKFVSNTILNANAFEKLIK
ncbi:MAG: YoaP domain-containing protein, partial [Clostridia bacterium]|nr:YoaP domain-containing protein [Clostridia bacterium]